MGPPPWRRRRRHGLQPAGEILLVAVAALLVAALVNVDALVERAERKPLGPTRDLSLAIWHPVQDVAHVLQLHRIRQLGDWVAGSDETAPTTPPTTVPDDGGPTRTLPPRPELRPPTAAAPLRLWVGGDSIVRDVSESVLRLAADDPLLSPVAHYEISSGLTRPDYFDWPAALAADMAATDPEVVFVMFGANDAQGIVAAEGRVFQEVSDPGWQDEYRSRVEAVMDQLRADGRLVFWVGQPPMRDAAFDARIAILDRIYREAAESRPWVEFVDTVPLFGAPDGTYRDRLPGPDGSPLDLRQGDGIHLSREGADLLATHLLDLVAAEIEQVSPTTTATTAPTAATTTTATASG
ncbi:MAG: DUF459 domain-containing protein [Actinomycetota bacterium]|nr:DUF459 domain-containing protein [Acidimicrobiia bacterium]MDQ3292938.1 DUF459 domain-containing protein [Actinomycetota bacterium]